MQNLKVIAQGARYRGGNPMWSWLLHRITGVGMVLFVVAHITASFLTQRFGSGAGMAINAVYESPAFQLVMYFCVIYHALNGLRVIILDIRPSLMRFQREALWFQWLTFVPIYALAVLLIVLRAASGE